MKYTFLFISSLWLFIGEFILVMENIIYRQLYY